MAEKGTGKHNHIALPHHRINFIHVVPLNAGTLFAAVSTKAPLTAVDIHTVQEKLGYSMAGTLRTLGERFDQRGGITISAGTTIENDNLLGQGILPP